MCENVRKIESVRTICSSSKTFASSMFDEQISRARNAFREKCRQIDLSTTSPFTLERQSLTLPCLRSSCTKSCLQALVAASFLFPQTRSIKGRVTAHTNCHGNHYARELSITILTAAGIKVITAVQARPPRPQILTPASLCVCSFVYNTARLSNRSVFIPPQQATICTFS